MRVILIPGWMNSFREASAEPTHRERSRPWEDRAAIIRKRTGLPTEVEWFRQESENAGRRSASQMGEQLGVDRR